MKEPYGEGVASHTGPESCVVSREAGYEVLIRGTCRRGIQRQAPPLPEVWRSISNLYNLVR
jgi:hypothetical protein